MRLFKWAKHVIQGKEMTNPSVLFQAIQDYKEAKTRTEVYLRTAIWEAMQAAGFNDVKEADIAIVHGHEIIQLAYCYTEGNVVRVDLDGNVDLGSIVLYC